MIDTKKIDDIVVFKLMHRIDLEQIQELNQKFQEFLEDNHRFFVLNMIDVKDISSSGIGQVLDMFHRLDACCGRLVLSDLSAVCEYVLDLARLTDIFPTYRNDAEAIASFGISSLRV